MTRENEGVEHPSCEAEEVEETSNVGRDDHETGHDRLQREISVKILRIELLKIWIENGITVKIIAGEGE